MICPRATWRHPCRVESLPISHSLASVERHQWFEAALPTPAVASLCVEGQLGHPFFCTRGAPTTNRDFSFVDRVCPTAPSRRWQEQDTPRAVPGGCRWVAGPPPLPLPALGISMGAVWMGGASGDAYLAVTLATGCAPPPPHAHRLAGAGHPPRAVPGGCRWVAGPSPLPLPALGISMGTPWMGSKSRGTTLVTTLPIPRGPRSPLPCLPG